MRIFLTGFMGSGKSYMGQRLAQRSGLPFFDLDEMIETGEGKSVKDIFTEAGEDHFRQLERKYLNIFISNETRAILSTGGGTPCFFDNIQKMRTAGMVIYLDTSVGLLATRLKKEQEKRPLIAGKKPKELEMFLRHKIAERLPYYLQAHVIVEQKNDEQDLASELSKTLIQLLGH